MSRKKEKMTTAELRMRETWHRVLITLRASRQGPKLMRRILMLGRPAAPESPPEEENAPVSGPLKKHP